MRAPLSGEQEAALTQQEEELEALEEALDAQLKEALAAKAAGDPPLDGLDPKVGCKRGSSSSDTSNNNNARGGDRPSDHQPEAGQEGARGGGL